MNMMHQICYVHCLLVCSNLVVETHYRFKKIPSNKNKCVVLGFGNGQNILILFWGGE